MKENMVKVRLKINGDIRIITKKKYGTMLKHLDLIEDVVEKLKIKKKRVGRPAKKKK